MTDCARINILVGDNGSGKTALLESIFLTLASSTQLVLRLRQMRGLDGVIGGDARRVEAAVWGDLFHGFDMSNSVEVNLEGEGPERRSLRISRGSSDAILPFGETAVAALKQSQPIRFVWTDSSGQEREVSPTLGTGGLTFPDTGELVPDFFFFSASQQIGSVENAGRFSELSKINAHRTFVGALNKEYPWVNDLNVEVHGGAPAIFATLEGVERKVPLPYVSGGLNYVVAILLAISARADGVVLVDEIESGIFHTHLPGVWKAILKFSKDFNCQLFVTTHSKECLEALVQAADGDFDDIAFWRTARKVDGPHISRFHGQTLRAGIEYGNEIR